MSSRRIEDLTRRGFVGSAGAALLGSALSAETAHRSSDPVVASARSRKNLVLFMPDELRADALACYGNPLTRTPNFDRLATEGTQFTNCHVQYPICGPSRCSMLTGWPTSVRGHRSNSYFLRANEPNMFRYLKQSGYDVFWFGKNDALAADSVFDSLTEWNYSEGRALTGPKDAAGPAATPDAPRNKKIPTTFLGSAGPDRRQTAEFGLIQAAVRILERKESDKPFCIFLPLSSPHPPYSAPRDFHDMYRPSDIVGLTPATLKRRPEFHAALRKISALDTVSADTFRQIRAIYLGMTSFSDWLMGELLEALERTGHVRDTAVMLFADHGDYAGDFGLVEKWPSGLEDQMTHIPLIIRSPEGVKGNKVVTPVMLFDVMPTCLDLANIKAEHTHFAESLTPCLAGQKLEGRKATFSEGGYDTFEPQCFEPPPAPGAWYHDRLTLQIEQPETVSRAACVRTTGHKLVIRPNGQNEFYQYDDDPRELTNRIDDPSLAPVQAQLRDQLLDWYIQTTGVAPMDKDQRELSPFRPTPVFKSSI